MQVLNFNFLSLIFFIIIISIIIIKFLAFYREQKLLEKNFKLFSKGKKFYLKVTFLFLSFLIIFLSIFRIKYFTDEKESKNGIDIVFVLDVSKSMNVSDIKGEGGYYTRLDFAKKAIADFVLSHKDNRFGLIIFSGEAKSTLPLTSDTDLFLTFLQNVDYKNFEKQGSSFREALILAEKRILSSEDSSKAIIFISDGGDEDDEISNNIKNYKDKNSKYFVFGVGSEKGGKIILGKDVFGNFNYQRYNGQNVIVKLNSKNLQKLASLLDADYIKANKVSDLGKINSDFESLQKNVFIKNNSDLAKSFSRILAFISLFFFIMFLIIFIIDEKKYEK